jgi:hypothetical protein
LRKQPEELPEALRALKERPDAAEVPRGFRLRRIGPAQWVAEPHSLRWRIWGVVLLACVLSSGASIQAMRLYHLRKWQAPLVVVNGTPIRRDQLLNTLEQRHGLRVVAQMVADELARQFAVSRGCWPSKRQIEERYRQEASRPGFLEGLLKANMTERDYRDRLALRLAEVNLITQGVKPSEADVRFFYERNVDPRNPKGRFRTPEKIQLAVIGTPTPQAARQAQLELMRDVPWPQVVSRFSADPSREDAGLLMPLARGESVFSQSPAAEEAIFRLREGDRSDVIPAGGKWWIVRCVRRWPAQVIPFDKARTEAEMGARIEIGAVRNARKVNEDRKAFVQRAVIQVFDPAYDAVARPAVSEPATLP